MLPLQVNFDSKHLVRRVFKTNRKKNPVTHPLYLKKALESHSLSDDPVVLLRLRRLAYRSLLRSLETQGSFRTIVENVLNNHPELLAQLMCDIYFGKNGNFVDWKYLQRVLVQAAYPMDSSLAIVEKIAKLRAANCY